MTIDLKKLLKMLYTLRYYRKSQLAWYLYYRARKLLPLSFWFTPKIPSSLTTDKKKMEKLKKFTKIWAESSSRYLIDAQKIFSSQFEYAGENCSIDYFHTSKQDNLSPLGKYGLHSFEPLWRLCLSYYHTNNNSIEELIKDCIVNWTKNNPPGTPLSWDPYPISFRIRYTLSACAMWGWNDPQILESVWTQIQYLYRSLEFHLLGNHIIQNLCGLLVGVEVFSLPFKNEILRLLKKELKEQILEDGGHYERVPMYHYHVLIDLLWLVAVLDPIPEFLIHTITKMLKFASNINLSDGNFPQFGDSAFYHLPNWEEISYVAKRLLNIELNNEKLSTGLIKLPDSGYYIFSYHKKNKLNHSKNNKPYVELVIRAGKTGPDYQLAHAHSDQLSYEMLINGIRFVVDSGIHGYAGSPLRPFQRSSRAHNIVCFDEVEQLETWGVFRVARRGKCEVEKVISDGETFKFHGTYHFYTGEKHKRIIEFNYPILSIRDEIYCQPKRRIFYNFIHFAPTVSIEPKNNCIIATISEINIKLIIDRTCFYSLVKGLDNFDQGWYSQRFGDFIANPVLVMEKHNTVKANSIEFEYRYQFE